MEFLLRRRNWRSPILFVSLQKTFPHSTVEKRYYGFVLVAGGVLTIALNKRSVEFFKDEAQKHHTQYQRMIRRLLDTYAEHHTRRRTAHTTRMRSKTVRRGAA